MNMALDTKYTRYYTFKFKRFISNFNSNGSRGGKVTVVLIFLLFGLFATLNEHQSKTEKIMKALGNRNTSDHLKIYEDTIILDATKGCQFNGKNLEATIIVTTLPSSIERRYAIRKTWENWKYETNVMVFFFTGRPAPHEMDAIKKEVQLHGDLIVEDLEESYNSLTIKTLRMLKWYLGHCPKSKFLIKTDDDVFINIPNLLRYLQTVPINEIKENYIGGLIHKGRSPHNWNPWSKWYVPSQLLWPSIINRNEPQELPNYAGGPFYILSTEVVSKLYAASLQVPLFNLEDVYLTGILGYDKLKLKLYDIPLIYDAHYPRFKYYFSSGVELWFMIAFHTDGDSGLMFKLYEFIIS